MISIYRPLRGKLHVRLPYAPGNRGMLRRIVGGGCPVAYDGESRAWRLAQGNLFLLLCRLPRPIELLIESRPGAEKCDVRCAEAVGFDCECSCGGVNHGGTTTGWLSVGATTLIRRGDLTVTRRVIPQEPTP